MQIPESLQHFPEPALIVTADHFHARLWLAFEDSMEEVESFEMTKTALSDKEGMDIGQEMTDEERLHKFARVISERVTHLVRDEQAATTVHLIAPPDFAPLIKKDLAPEAMNAIGKELHVNVMKEDESQILERIVAA